MTAEYCHGLASPALNISILVLQKRVSIGYTSVMKDSGLRIRVERELRKQFVEVCRAEDKPAAQVLREFMRAYVARDGGIDTGTSTRNLKKKHRPG